MKDAVIVSTARTGIGKAGRGSLNLTHGATMGGHVAAVAAGQDDSGAFGGIETRDGLRHRRGRAQDHHAAGIGSHG